MSVWVDDQRGPLRLGFLNGERKRRRKGRENRAESSVKRDGGIFHGGHTMANLHCRAGGDRFFFFFLFLYVVFFNVLRSLVDVHPKSDPYPPRFRREGNWSLFRFGWDSNRDRA